jgi:hypothetical protein
MYSKLHHISDTLTATVSCGLAILVFTEFVPPPLAEAVEAAKVVPWLNAEQLLSECSSPVNSSEDKSCVDYIEGIKDTLSYLREDRQDQVATSIELPCLPHAITAGALKAVIVTFIQRNPQYYSMAAAPVTYAALAAAFPCP